MWPPGTIDVRRPIKIRFLQPGKRAIYCAAGETAGWKEGASMPTIFVATSASLQRWASDVGLTQHVYKLGVSGDGGQTAVDTLNAGTHAGRSDWELVAEQAIEFIEEQAALARAARKETPIDPHYYPQIKRAAGIFKVKLANVENHFLVRDALEGQEIKRVKLSPAQIGTYLIRMATG
jgi:hypothetical protein